MSPELETGLPSTRLLQTYLRDQRPVEVKLITGDTITGKIIWQDPNCLCVSENDQQVLIWRSALACVKGI
ncbi:MAG: RNA-binding protein hfq [Cyanobacteria bacterium P01_H01_bin.58]